MTVKFKISTMTRIFKGHELKQFFVMLHDDVNKNIMIMGIRNNGVFVILRSLRPHHTEVNRVMKDLNIIRDAQRRVGWKINENHKREESFFSFGDPRVREELMKVLVESDRISTFEEQFPALRLAVATTDNELIGVW